MKIKYVTAAIILALTFGMIATGQKRAKSQRAPRPQPSATATPTPLSTLSIEVGLVFGNGDVKPVARTRFYLLDDDLRTILKSIDVDIGGGSPVSVGSRIAFARSAASSREDGSEGKINAAIATHVIATVTTDFGGNAKFESLQPGTKFVYGEYQVGRSNLAWNARVDLRAGENASLVLDNKN
jgi:hypothetical protein